MESIGSTIDTIQRHWLLLFLSKATILLFIAWVANWSLERYNPRWRVLLWRSVVLGTLGLGMLTIRSPSFLWPVLPSFTEPQRQVSHLPMRERTRAVAPSIDNDAVTAHWQDSETRSSTIRSSTNRHHIPEKAATDAIAAPDSAARGSANLAKGTFLAIWLTGMALFILRLLFAKRCLSRLIRSATPVDQEIQILAEETARELKCRSIKVLHSTNFETPCIVGVRHPIILLPAALTSTIDEDSMRAVLAHEIGHVLGRDIFWNYVLHGFSLAFWFHPLVWRARTAHANACDRVCDALAAGHIGSVKNYGRVLASLAVRATELVPKVALAMARISEVRGRILALERKLFLSALSLRARMTSCLVLLGIITILGISGLSRAQIIRIVPAVREIQGGNPAAVIGNTASSGKMDIKVVAVESKQPLSGVAIAWTAICDGKSIRSLETTDGQGRCTLRWPAGSKVTSFHIDLDHPDFVLARARWNDSRHPVLLPNEKTFALEKGTSIGGRLQSSDTTPIAGAHVSIRARIDEFDGRKFESRLTTLKTDSAGRWHFDRAPSELTDVTLHIEHPNFRKKMLAASHDLETIIVLQRGLELKGVVIDGSDKPVALAQVTLGSSQFRGPKAKTNAAGEFLLENCPSGRSVLTVQARGFAPELKAVDVIDKQETLTIRLTTASTLRGRVVDIHGNPIANVDLMVDGWRGHESLQFRGRTNSTGEFVWHSAPADPVQFTFRAKGYADRIHHPLTATTEEQSVTLYPELTISGAVRDATNGKLIPKFTVVPAYHHEADGAPVWDHNGAFPSANGEYLVKSTYATKISLRLEAVGYLPVTAGPYDPATGPVTKDFSLSPANLLAGVIVGADGDPAAGIEVSLVETGKSVHMSQGNFDQRIAGGAPRVTTNDRGEFSFTSPISGGFLVAAGNRGFAEIPIADLRATGKIALHPWGSIQGTAMIGSEPAVDTVINYQPDGRTQGEISRFYNYSTRTDREGNFVLERLPPGSGRIGRSLVTRRDSSIAYHYGWFQKVKIEPGVATLLTLGGKGRPVSGKLLPLGAPQPAIDWRYNSPVTLVGINAEGKPTVAVNRCVGTIEPDGHFQIEDVTPGQYELTATIDEPQTPASKGSSYSLGRRSMTVIVPEVPNNGEALPVELGTIEIPLFDPLEVGEQAPGFTASTIEEGEVSLATYHGKVVLLNFWTARQPASIEFMNVLSDIHREFGRDPRFALINLSCDGRMDYPKEFLKKHPLPWPQGYVGMPETGVGRDYSVRSMPATFLIDSVGRVIARDLRGEKLREAVVDALQKP